MHAHIIFLVKADGLEEARDEVRSYAEDMAYREWWDYGGIVEESEDFNRPIAEVDWSKVNIPDHIKSAEVFVKQAEIEKLKGGISMAGYYYRRAGELFSEMISHEHPIYNYSDGTYKMPAETDGWYAIESDLHF
jgi:beta-galactosidase GanA